MSKLSFRARALDASKPMPIFMAEELPDLPDYSAINRAVPQMPSGMKKEEECEHHLQRAICAGLIIPTPEVSDIPDNEHYDKLYPANYKQPRQLIHMQPFAMEQDIPDYDMDSEDERWLMSQAGKLELSPLKFEEMMDRLEKSSGQTVVTLNEAKALLKEDDDLIIAVFDYWLNKRLKTQHPLILSVKTEHRAGISINNPYLAFRRRTEKMQTRKNRKNDETSYEKMLKLKRDLCRAVTLLELVKRREKIKREFLHLTVEVFEKRYQARDFSGSIVAEVTTLKATRPAFTPIFHNQYTNQSWSNKAILKDEVIPRKEKRQYKKRKHKWIRARMDSVGAFSSDEEPVPQISPEPEEVEDEGLFAFRRNKLCSYHMPVQTEGNWPWCSKEENGLADKRFRYTLTSLSNPRRCIGFARRRVGRGGRIILDRVSTDCDELWRTLDFTIYEPTRNASSSEKSGNTDSDLASSTNFFSISSSAGVCSIVSSDKCIKTESNEFSHFDNRLRTSVNESTVGECVSEIKKEPGLEEEGVRQLESLALPTKEEQDEMIEFLRAVQRDWLHFRPKTPPADYEPPCHMLPADDNIFIPSANTPFSLELQALDTPSMLLDTSTFITSPFMIEDLNLDVPEVVPITDTRQSSDKNVQTGINLNVNVGLNTLTSSVNDSYSSNVNLDDSSISGADDYVVTLTDNDCDNNRTIGCSTFCVFDESVGVSGMSKKHTFLSSTLLSPKYNSSSVDATSGDRQLLATESTLSNANGLLSQFGLDGSPTCKLKSSNKVPNAYPSGGSYSNSPRTLSLHTSAHTLTLNSHSANIVEIPLSNDSDKVPNKVVNSQCAESSGTPPNNKNKTIVRKNNMVMEVT